MMKRAEGGSDLEHDDGMNIMVKFSNIFSKVLFSLASFDGVQVSNSENIRGLIFFSLS